MTLSSFVQLLLSVYKTVHLLLSLYKTLSYFVQLLLSVYKTLSIFYFHFTRLCHTLSNFYFQCTNLKKLQGGNNPSVLHRLLVMIGEVLRDISFRRWYLRFFRSDLSDF